MFVSQKKYEKLYQEYAELKARDERIEEHALLLSQAFDGLREQMASIGVRVEVEKNMYCGLGATLDWRPRGSFRATYVGKDGAVSPTVGLLTAIDEARRNRKTGGKS